MDDELINKFREIISDEKQLKILTDSVDNIPNFEDFLKENDENIKLVAERFLKINAEKERELALLDNQIQALKFSCNIGLGLDGELEVSSEKVKAVDNWLKAVAADDEKAILENSQAAAVAIKAMVISGEAFKKKKSGRGRPPDKDNENCTIWAFSECHGVLTAATEFNKSESSIKKIRKQFADLKKRLSVQDIDDLTQKIVGGYIKRKSKK